MVSTCTVTEEGRRYLIVRSLDRMDAILDPNVNVALVERELPVAIREELERGLRDAAAKGEGEASSLARLCPGAWTAIRADIDALAARYRAITGVKHPHVALELVDYGACRKLHSDAVGLRLLVTYFGPGTIWVADRDVDRRHLGATDADIDVVNRRIADPAKWRRAPTGSVLLLKGDRFRGNAGHGAVHRSPSVAGLGVPRLVLKIDDASDCGC